MGVRHDVRRSNGGVQIFLAFFPLSVLFSPVIRYTNQVMPDPDQVRDDGSGIPDVPAGWLYLYSARAAFAGKKTMACLFPFPGRNVGAGAEHYLHACVLHGAL